MKKYIILLIYLLLCLGCTESTQKVEAEEDAAVLKTIETWQYAIKSLSYSLYSRTELYPSGKEVFLSQFRTRYYANIIILSQSKTEVRQIDGVSYKYREVQLAAEIADRDTNAVKGMIQGTVEVVRPDHEGTNWQIHNTILIEKK